MMTTLHVAASPGQAITYETGKLQILSFLTDARLRLGDRFSLRAFYRDFDRLSPEQITGHGPGFAWCYDERKYVR